MVLVLEQKVGWLAFVSRVIVILQLVICSFLPSHDADIFKPQIGAAHNLTSVDQQVLSTLSGFLNWDSRYFHFITNHGYIYQNTLVFMPLFPLLVRLLSCTIFYPLHWLLSDAIVTLIAGILLNNACFIVSARLLYRLGCRVVGDNTLAYKAALIFCFNPASVFFSVFYSESLFFLLSLIGFLLMESRTMLPSSMVLGLTTCCRSNGVLYCIFALHRTGYLFFSNAARILGMSGKVAVFPLLVSCLFFLVPGILYVAIIVLPFLATQCYDYYLYCHVNETWTNPAMNLLYPKLSVPKALARYGRQRNYLLIGQRPNWCDNTVPMSYQAIQSSHWGVGFLKYYEIRQLPNFALAAPILIVAMVGILDFARQYVPVLKTFGMTSFSYLQIRLQRERLIVKRLTPYLLHMAAIMLFLIFTIHVQIITRLMLSSNPCIYWILSYLLCDRIMIYEAENEMDIFRRIKSRKSSYIVQVETEKNRYGNLLLDDLTNFLRLQFSRKLVVLYIMVYFICGIYMHGCSLPWT